MKKFKIKCDFNENQVESDISKFFGMLSAISRRHYRLLSVDEQATGADKSYIDGAVAYFFQYKAPTGLRPTSVVPLTSQKANEALQMVRRFRHEKDLRQEPYSLCFKLRDQRNPEKPLQHNVLLGYERPPYSRAMYVCPTILSETEYTAQLHNDVAIRFWDKLFYYRDFQILTEPGWASSIVGSVPFLRAHMSIIPHRPVESSDHYYSFSKYANDLAFHSPEILPDTGGRLGDFISSEILKFDRGEKRFLRPYELSMEIYKSTPDHIKYSLGEPTDNNASEWISKHGKILREEYEISQLILVASKMQL